MKKRIKIEKEFFEDIYSLPQKIEEVLKNSENIILLAERFKDSKNGILLKISSPSK